MAKKATSTRVALTKKANLTRGQSAVFTRSIPDSAHEYPAAEFASVPIGSLTIDPDYQRAIKAKQATYVHKWDWAAFGCLIVNRRKNGDLVILDGLQRWTAAKSRPEVSHVPCVIFNIEDIEQEATTFCNINIHRSNMGAVDKFWGAYTAGEKQYREIVELATDCKVWLKHPRHKKPDDYGFEFTALGTLLEVHELGVLEECFEILQKLEHRATQKEFAKRAYFGGMAFFLRGAEVIGSDGGWADIDRIVKVLNSLQLAGPEKSFSNWASRAAALSPTTGMGGGAMKWYGKAFTAEYNRRLPKAKKVTYSPPLLISEAA